MKKKLLLLMMLFAISAATFAQDKVVKHRDKVRKTSTPGQKVHNLFHKHKHYNGYKVKHVKKVEKVS
jgi:hypothetical protein